MTSDPWLGRGLWTHNIQATKIKTGLRVAGLAKAPESLDPDEVCISVNL